jgi:hypothetical protein
VYSQAKELQQLLMESARSKETTPSALAQVARAFSDLEELKLRLRMKPAPKPVDVAALQAAKAKRQKPATAFDYGQAGEPDTTTGSVPPDAPS